jgi:hypothetical protein
VNVPAEIVDLYFVHFDSYDIANFFNELKQLADALPSIQFAFKFRPKGLHLHHRAYLEWLFPNGRAVLFDTEDPLELLRIADAALSGNSALTYEAMLIGTPTIVYPLLAHDLYFREAISKAAAIPTSADKLTEEIRCLMEDPNRLEQARTTADTYLKKNYSFDGHAAERLKTLLAETLIAYGANE